MLFKNGDSNCMICLKANRCELLLCEGILRWMFEGDGLCNKNEVNNHGLEERACAVQLHQLLSIYPALREIVLYSKPRIM